VRVQSTLDIVNTICSSTETTTSTTTGIAITTIAIGKMITEYCVSLISSDLRIKLRLNTIHCLKNCPMKRKEIIVIYAFFAKICAIFNLILLVGNSLIFILHIVQRFLRKSAVTVGSNIFEMLTICVLLSNFVSYQPQKPKVRYF